MIIKADKFTVKMEAKMTITEEFTVKPENITVKTSLKIKNNQNLGKNTVNVSVHKIKQLYIIPF